MTKSRILVPIDFSDQSNAALLYAMKIAMDTKEMISCMHVIEDPVGLSDLLMSQEIKHKLRREAEQKLSERVNSILSKKDDLEFEIIISSGKVAQKILEKSIDLHVRLIIMGKAIAGEKGYQSIGSNLKQVLAKSRIPVVAISNQKNLERENIILPLELFKPIAAQLKYAIEIALKTNARIMVISVVDNGMSSLIPIYENTLKDINLLLKDIKVSCYTKLLLKNTTVSQEILSFSRGIDSGFILLMTRNEKNHPGRHVGSTAKEIIAHSEIPVQCFSPELFIGISMEDSDFPLQANPLTEFISKGKLINDPTEF